MGQEMESFERFMKNELAKYIHAELLKGHSPIAIKETLLKGGHHHDMIEEVLDILKESNYDINVALKKGATGRILKQDMFYDILNAVIKYIELMLEYGHDIHSIEHMLYKFGHSKALVNRAIDAVLFGKKDEDIKEPESVNDYVAMAEKFIFPLLLAIYVVLCLLISSAANVGVDRVMLGFLALLFTIVAGGVLSPRLNSKNRPSILALPVLFSLLFYLLGTTDLAFLARLDVSRLSILNLLFGLIFMAIIIVTAVDRETQKERKSHLEEEPKVLVGEEVKEEESEK